MKKYLFIFMLIAGIIITGCSANKNTNETVKENNDPEDNRIVATTVAIADIMDALEIDLIGIPSSYKDLPERFDGVTEVGGAHTPDMELILSLQPKEIMAVSTLAYDLEPIFDDAGIEARYVNLESIDNMHEEIIEIASKYGREEQAEKIVNDFADKLAEIESRIEGKEKPSVLVLMGIPGSYLVATDKSYIGSLVEKSGGINVFSGENVEYLASNTEHLQQ